MCIILACKPGCRPTSDVLENCWFSNPDGAGAMWCEDGKVRISKGYMRLKDVKSLMGEIPDESPLVLHFRIGTSGGHSERVTHPYPVTSDLDCLHALDLECPVGIAHNGILPYPHDDVREISDTIAYVQTVVAPLSHARKVRAGGGLTHSKFAAERLKATSRGSRLCVLSADGSMRLTGAGWNGVSRGIQASNESWRGFRAYKWSKCSLADWHSYIDDYDDTDYIAEAMDAFGCYGCERYESCVDSPECFTAADAKDIVTGDFWGRSYAKSYDV